MTRSIIRKLSARDEHADMILENDTGRRTRDREPTRATDSRKTVNSGMSFETEGKKTEESKKGLNERV